jgi:hypothetical protein
VSLPIRHEVQALVRIRPDCEWFALGLVPAHASGLYRLCVRPPRCRWHHQVPRVPLPDLGVTLIRETCTASCEDITPRSSLLQTHASIPLALLSFGLSLVRGVSAGCDQPLLLAGPSRRYLCESFPACLGPCHGGPVECTCLFLPPRHRPSPVHYRGRLPAYTRQNDFMTDPFFETAAISLCSGPQVCSPPRSFLPLPLIAAGQPRLLRPS